VLANGEGVTRAVPGSEASPGERPSSTGAPVDPGIVAWYVEGFSDRLGDRLLLYDNTGPALELLRLAPQLAAAPGFEAALRARIDQLKAFKHPVFARVRCVTTLDDPRPQLAIVSELVPGQRLSDVLRAAEHERAKPNPGAAVWLLRQLLPGLRTLHDLAPGVAHGLLGVDRIVVTPDGRLAITEYVLADGIERLGLSVADLWRHFGIAAFESPSGPTLNARSDVAGMGLLALSVLLGRPLRTDEYPAKVPELLEEACSARHWMLAPMLRPWLQRALGVGAPAFETATAAEVELERLLPGVEGAWSRQLLPGTEQVTRLQPLERGAAATESGARALRSAREAEVAARAVQPAPPTVRPVPDRGITQPVRTEPVGVLRAQARVRRLRRWVAVLTIVAVAEAAGLVLLVGPSVQWTERAARIFRTYLNPAASPGTAERADMMPPLPAGTGPGAGVPSPPRAGAATNDAAGEGWVSIVSEIPLRVYLDGNFVGSGSTLRFRARAGDHGLTLVNDSLGYMLTQSLKVPAGRTLVVKPTLVRDTPAARP
jgi:hypothetical protein